MLKFFIAVALTALAFTANATCTQGSAEVSFSGTTSFDIVFNGVNANSINSDDLRNTSCSVDIPVTVPSGYFAILTDTTIAGSAIVDEDGGAAVGLTVGTDSISRSIYVNDTYTLSIPVSSAFSECGIDTTFTIGVDLISISAFINVFSASGSLLFVACE